MLNKKWQVKNKLPKELIQRFPEINPVTLQLLYNRGLDTQKKIDEFFYPDYSKDIHDPYLFRDMKKVVERLKIAMNKKEKIAVYGDYDADGVTATVVLVKTLQLYGFDPLVFIPHRDKEGFGLSEKPLNYLKEQKVDLVITVDCGIVNIKEVKLAYKLGLEVIISDHHEPEDELPSALAIIHTGLADGHYPFQFLAGVGVAYKIAQALLFSDLKPVQDVDKNSFAKWLLDLVALGTIADLVPLIGENRTLVKYGLVVLNKTRNIGLKKLIEMCRFKNSLIDSVGIAFRIAPRINAAGRMDHANTAYELLMTENEEKAADLANKLENSNQQRQKLTDQIFQEAIAQIGENPSEKLLLPFNQKWPKSLAGLVAGKLVDKYNRPVILTGGQNDIVYGSGRSIAGFNLLEIIQKLGDYFSISGGHPMAAGFTLKDKNQFGEFKSKIIELAEKRIIDTESILTQDIDLEIELKQIDWLLFEDLEKFEPFGETNPRPLFLCRGVDVVGLENVGLENKHIRLIVAQKGEATKKMIGFCLAEACGNLCIGDKIDVLFEISLNEWKGNRELQLKLVDFRKDLRT